MSPLAEFTCNLLNTPAPPGRKFSQLKLLWLFTINKSPLKLSTTSNLLIIMYNFQSYRPFSKNLK